MARVVGSLDPSGLASPHVRVHPRPPACALGTCGKGRRVGLSAADPSLDISLACCLPCLHWTALVRTEPDSSVPPSLQYVLVECTSCPKDYPRRGLHCPILNVYCVQITFLKFGMMLRCSTVEQQRPPFDFDQVAVSRTIPLALGSSS